MRPHDAYLFISKDIFRAKVFILKDTFLRKLFFPIGQKALLLLHNRPNRPLLLSIDFLKT